MEVSRVSGYSDHYKDTRQAEFLRRWAPNEPWPESVTAENMRWNIARANAAEAELKQIKDALKVLRQAID